MSITIFPHMVSRKSLVGDFSSDDYMAIKLFKERSKELFQTKRKYPNWPISKTSRVHDSLVFHGNTPDIDTVKLLALNFRFFYATKELTHFETIINSIRRHAIDDWAKGYLDHVKSSYKKDMRSTDVSGNMGRPTTNREIIDYWFNSKFFHSDVSKNSILQALHNEIGEHTSLFQLNLAIAKCSSHIASLYVALNQLEEAHPYIYTPNHNFGYKTQSAV